jgi:hypothetical protein
LPPDQGVPSTNTWQVCLSTGEFWQLYFLTREFSLKNTSVWKQNFQVLRENSMPVVQELLSLESEFPGVKRELPGGEAGSPRLHLSGKVIA